jgi:hypothetical protein
MKGKVLGIARGAAQESHPAHFGAPLFQIHSIAGQNSLRKNKLFESSWRPTFLSLNALLQGPVNLSHYLGWFVLSGDFGCRGIANEHHQKFGILLRRAATSNEFRRNAQCRLACSGLNADSSVRV